MRHLRRRRRSRWIFVWVGAGLLAILGYGLISGWLRLPAMPGIGLEATSPAIESTQLPETLAAPSETVTPVDGNLTPASTLSVTLIGPASSTDIWANALLDRVKDRLQHPGQPGDGFAWWQGNEAIDFLSYSDQVVLFKGSHLSIDNQSSIDVWVVSQSDPNQLQRVASIQTESSALVLGVTSRQPDQAEMQWIVTGSAPDTALESLVIQAAARSLNLKIAYDPGSDQDRGALVLLGAVSLVGTTPTPTQTGTVQTAAAQPAAATPTATHSPEAALGIVIEAKLKPVIDAGLSFPPDVVAAFTAGHAWNGFLTWDETGPKVDDRPVNVNQAIELTFQILTPNDPRGPTQPFLKTEYTGNVTRFPDEQTYFTGQRMNEILYWMVSYGARRGGLLRVSYDDFGTRQAMTFTGFVPFAQPGSQTPNP